MTTTWQYNSADQMTRMTYPSGMVLDYSYLPQGGTRTVTAGLPGEQTTIAIQTDLQVDELGRVKLRSLGNSTHTDYTYKDFLEDANRLNSIQSATETGTTFQNYNYEYDGVGNITKIKDTEDIYRVFTYDEMNRLLTSIGVGGLWAGGTYDIATSYDPTTGNLSSKGGNSYSYDEDKPHAVISDGSRTFTYDANGNVTDITLQTVQVLDEGGEITTTTVSRNYTYNAEGKLIAYSNNNGMVRSFVYDGDGQRTVEQNSNGSMIFYMGNYLEQHLPGSSSEKREYIYADGIRLAVRINEASNTDNFYWFHLDHLGGTNMVTRGDGEVSTTYLYDAWGGMYYEQGQGTVTDRLYTGQTRVEDDLYYYGARWYDPSLGRFLQADTILPVQQGTQGWDRYAYVNNNPTNFFDKLGFEIGGWDDDYLLKQWGNSCGPTSLAMAVSTITGGTQNVGLVKTSYWWSYVKITIGNVELEGLGNPPETLIATANNKLNEIISAKLSKGGTLEDIKKNVENNIPTIMYFNVGLSGHYVLILDYKVEEGFIFADPAYGTKMTEKELLDNWAPGLSIEELWGMGGIFESNQYISVYGPKSPQEIIKPNRRLEESL